MRITRETIIIKEIRVKMIRGNVYDRRDNKNKWARL